MYQEQLYDKDRDHQGIYKNQSLVVNEDNQGTCHYENLHPLPHLPLLPLPPLPLPLPHPPLHLPPECFQLRLIPYTSGRYHRYLMT